MCPTNPLRVGSAHCEHRAPTVGALVADWTMQLLENCEALHLNLGRGTENHDPFKGMTAMGKLITGIMWQQPATCRQKCVSLIVVS